MNISSISLLLASAVALTLASPALAQSSAQPPQSGPAPGSLAHFRFNGTAGDEHPGNPSFLLKNTEFRENALYLNGKYENDGGKDGYRAICPAPKLDYHKFTVALRFKAEAFGEKNPTGPFGDRKSTIFMGGEGYRWFGMSRSKAGHLVITMNNSRYHWEIDEAPLKTDTWTVVACGVDVNARKVAVYLNGKKAASFNLPPDFKLDAVDADPRGSDKLWTFTDYSHGGTFQGLIDECIIYGEMLSDEAMAAIPLAP